MSIQKLPIPLGGGVNLHNDPSVIPDGQWQRLRNLAPRLPGVLGQRPSMSFVREVTPSWWNWDARTRLGSAGVASAVDAYWKWAKYIRPLKFIFDPNFSDITMVVVTTAAITVAAETSAGVQTATVVPEDTMLLITLPGVITGTGTEPMLRVGVLGPASRMPSLLVFNGITYAFNGYDNGKHIAAGSDGATPVTFSYYNNNFGTGNTNFAPDGACVVRDRVLYYKGPNVYFSDRNEPLTVGYTGSLDANGDIVPSTANPATGTNFSAIDTRGIFLGGEELENITAVAEVNTSADGSPVQSVAMVFTSTHAYMLLGEPLETTEGGKVVGSLQINRLNVQAGCVSQATVTRTPYGTLWCGREDVWFMPFGSLPIRVGTSIRPLLEQQPPGLAWKLHAEYADGFYRLSMFKPGQGPNTADPCGMQMWLDMRAGGPKSAEQAQWFGPQEFNQTDAPTSAPDPGGPGGVWCMARDSRAGGDGRLYALQSFVMLGSTAPAGTAYISGMSLCGFSAVDGRDTCAPNAEPALWEPSYAYSAGDIVVPTPATTSLLAPRFVCTTAGTSATAAPAWITGISGTGTITDGTVTWTAIYFDGTYLFSAYVPNIAQTNNEVELSMLSREFMLGDPMREKLLDGAELGYWALNRTQVTYNSHAKQDSRSRILGLTAEQTADNVANQTTGDRVWQRKLLTPSPTKRFHGLSATWELQQDAGIVITLGVNDTITFTYASASHPLTIPAGYYADILAVVTALVTASAGGLTSSVSGAVIGFKSASMTGVSIQAQGRLSELLGFGVAGQQTATGGNYVYGVESPRYTLVPDIQFSGLNLRFKMFGRGPS